jgi:signal transduction histidine kinase
MSTDSRKTQDRMERLVRGVPPLVEELRLDALLQRVADMAAEIVGAKYAAVGLLSPDGQTLESFVVSGMSASERAALGRPPAGRGVLGTVIREGRPLRLSDVRSHPESVGFPPGHPMMRSFLAVPIQATPGTVGQLYLAEKTGGTEFDAADEHFAVLLALVTGSAVENARLHTDRARLLEEVQQLHRSRERFFAMVNHELRNALAAVYGWAEMLVRRKDPAGVPRAAYEILDSAEQAVALISDLLDLSRLDEDRLKPVFRNVEAAGVVRGAIQRVTPFAQEGHITFATEGDGEGLICRTDPHRVEQIMVNLLRNAVRHSPQKSAVTTDVRRAEGMIEFRVRDQGPGIPPEDREKVFDVYFTSVSEERLGHGLGLPLSRRLARLLGGELLVDEPTGKGAVFLLRLPIAAPVTP